MKGWTKEMVRVTVETNYPFCNGVTKDEALQLAHDLLGELKNARKETAEKFAERLKAQYPPRTDKRCTLDDCYMLDKIDEICKEFTGGKV